MASTLPAGIERKVKDPKQATSPSNHVSPDMHVLLAQSGLSAIKGQIMQGTSLTAVFDVLVKQTTAARSSDELGEVCFRTAMVLTGLVNAIVTIAAAAFEVSADGGASAFNDIYRGSDKDITTFGKFDPKADKLAPSLSRIRGEARLSPSARKHIGDTIIDTINAGPDAIGRKGDGGQQDIVVNSDKGKASLGKAKDVADKIKKKAMKKGARDADASHRLVTLLELIWQYGSLFNGVVASSVTSGGGVQARGQSLPRTVVSAGRESGAAIGDTRDLTTIRTILITALVTLRGLVAQLEIWLIEVEGTRVADKLKYAGQSATLKDAKFRFG